jgi:hypothetical protein
MFIYIIIILAIITRFIPHMPNFAPITALAIFSAANLGWKKSVGLTLAARLISDIFLGFFSWPLMVAVYASHLIGVLLGLWIKKSERYRWAKIIGSSFAASFLFFIVTNFAFLYSGYSHDISGIMSSYINGLPFFRGTLLGDLGYTSALFGAYQFALYAKSIKRLNRATA